MNQVDSETINIVMHDAFSAEDFLSRWQQARISSLLKAIPHATDRSESALLQHASKLAEETRDQILKDVFLCSWQLGQSTKRYFGLIWEIHDFKDVLNQSKIRCLQGDWTSTSNHAVLQRPGCEQGSSLGSFVCNYWREAVDGIVMGCGASARYARLKNKMLNDNQCEDVFFLEEDAEKNLYPPVPDTMLATLKPVLASISRLKISVELKGLRDGHLYYDLVTDPSLNCSSVPSIASNLLQQQMNKHFPQIKLVSVSPRSVMDS